MADRDLAPLLLLTRQADLVSEVLRLAAAASVAVEVVGHPDEALHDWVAAPGVLVGADVAGEVASVGPPRRDDVHLVAWGAADDATFRAAVALGASSVLELPDAEAWLAALLADVGDGGPGGGTVVGVVGGSGGAGATVLAAALAVTAGHVAPVALVDLDPLGPGGHRVLGLDEVAGVSWADLADSRGRLGSRSLRQALPRRGAVGFLGWPPGEAAPVRLSPPVMREVVSAAARGHDWVFLDLPRADERTLSDALLRCDHVLLVARAGVCHVAAAARVAAQVAEGPAHVGAVVRTHPGSPRPEEVAGALGLPLLTELPGQRRLDEHLDLGVGPVHHRRSPLARVADHLLGLMAGGQ